MQLTVTEARKRWSEVLDRVQRGETVSVTRRGKLIASFAPPEPAAKPTVVGVAKSE